MQSVGSPYTNWRVQLATGQTGASTYVAGAVNWGPVLDSSESSDDDHRSAVRSSGFEASNLNVDQSDVDLVDMNGDGLPDRVRRTVSGPHNALLVALNNSRTAGGSGFDPSVSWPNGGFIYQTSTSQVRASSTLAGLYDMNGDGLADGVFLQGAYETPAAVSVFNVVLNNGASMETTVNDWRPVDHDPYDSAYSINTTGALGNNTTATLVDINGDGLPDLVTASDSDHFTVRLNDGCHFGPAIAWSNVASYSTYIKALSPDKNPPTDTIVALWTLTAMGWSTA